MPPADFFADLDSLLENWDERFLSIIGFRGSTKSTRASVALTLWAALEGKSKFIIPIFDTDTQGKINIADIRHELENNEAIKKDYGDMGKGIVKTREWTQTNIVLANGTRILARSRGQRIRGLRHRQWRPDLAIVDDPEDAEKVQKKEYRDKTERWLRGDLIPAIEEFKARLILIGNILHTDALMARLKNDPMFTRREYPLVDKNGHCTWSAKYPTKESLAQQEQKVGRTAWLREYLLKVVPPEGQEIKTEWIQKYDDLPRDAAGNAINIMAAGVGMDFAISKKEHADFTAMVSGVAAIVNGAPKIFILPNPMNERFSFHETIEAAKNTYGSLKTIAAPLFFPEDVAYQRAAIEEMQRNGIPCQPMRTGQDKRARLRTAGTFIQNGTVLFPHKGAEDLLAQVLGFGIEDHDDLADALVYLILGMTQHGFMQKPEVIGLL